MGWPSRLWWSGYLGRQVWRQAGFPFRSAEHVRRAQRARLRTMVAHAYASVPYYRETMRRLGLAPGDIREVEDLARLPLLEGDALQRDPEYFVSRAEPLSRYVEARTSGSTGAPRTIFLDRGAIFQNAAHGERERSIVTRAVGRSTGYREAWLGIRGDLAVKAQRLVVEEGYVPPGLRVRRQHVSVLDPPEEIVRQLNAIRPHLVHGSGSTLEFLFPHVRATGMRMHRPRAIVYTSADLSTAVRRLIEQGFGIPVFSTYTAAEALKIGFECTAHQGLHLNVDLYPLRIADGGGAAVAAGQRGEVVMSNLVNRATVLLNYRLGDIAALAPEACPCGRTLPLLTYLQGRTDDIVELPSGERFHPSVFRAAFSEEDAIWQYQVVHQSDSHFAVAVVTDERADRAEVQARLAARFARIFDDTITVSITFPPSIDRSGAGKLRAVVDRRRDSGSR